MFFKFLIAHHHIEPNRTSLFSLHVAEYNQCINVCISRKMVRNFTSVSAVPLTATIPLCATVAASSSILIVGAIVVYTSLCSAIVSFLLLKVHVT